jgi:hypothetical protein
MIRLSRWRWHYRIHRAIFRLLEIAPVEKHWLHALYSLLGELDFQQVAHPEKINTVLSRWAQLDDSGYEGKPLEGYFMSLSLKVEFRLPAGMCDIRGMGTEVRASR